MQIPRIALPALNVFVLAPQNLKVVRHKFNRSHVKAFAGQRNGIAPGSSPDIKQLDRRIFPSGAHKLNAVVDMLHRNRKFHDSVPGCEPVIFLEFIVILFQWRHMRKL